MQRLLSAIVLSVLAAVSAAGSSAQEVEIPVRERPMYGTAPTDSEVIKADERLLQSAIDRGVPREQVFRDAVAGGWQAFRAGEPGMAIRRFNLAWLLEPENGNVYWGFSAAVQARDGNLEQAAGFLARARKLMPNDAELMVDSANLMVRMGRFDDAIELYNGALALRPGFAAVDQGLALAYAGKRDYRRALVHAERAIERGAALPEQFLEDLRDRAK